MTVNERIEYLVKTYSGGNTSKFAKQIGVSHTSIASMLPGGRESKPGYEIIAKIIETFSEVTAEWIFNGEVQSGDEIEVGFKSGVAENNSTYPGKADKETHSEVISNEEAQKGKLPKNAIPLYEIEITAGNVQRFIEANDNIPLIGWIHLEDTASAKGLIGVGAKGESMAPYINNGDTMIIRRVENLNVVPPGQAYVIITGEQSMVKYIRVGSTQDKWNLRSHNREEFEDFEINKSDVKHLFIVVKVLKDIAY
ncbi:S24 family peptidase [Pontibacter sp. 172403-2]|uniref:S24 family peptidase n=1 Tax=Pontibacter rufus TaxID=2791028 RepID=UPI0018AFA7E6|nr:S24 family peptidase [Pontibacter sp. 172403-2]MBF9252445.1 S24 family peptidase [Pontibacter sp. 172403-2]